MYLRRTPSLICFVLDLHCFVAHLPSPTFASQPSSQPSLIVFEYKLHLEQPGPRDKLFFFAFTIFIYYYYYKTKISVQLKYKQRRKSSL